MSEDCGHHCCHIRTNGYHVHASEPAECDRCDSGVWPRVATLTDQLVGHASGQSVETSQSAHPPAAGEGTRTPTPAATASSWL
jgi:hypothetical protein